MNRRELVREPEYRHTVLGIKWPFWRLLKLKPARALPVQSCVREERVRKNAR